MTGSPQAFADSIQRRAQVCRKHLEGLRGRSQAGLKVRQIGEDVIFKGVLDPTVQVGFHHHQGRLFQTRFQRRGQGAAADQPTLVLGNQIIDRLLIGGKQCQIQGNLKAHLARLATIPTPE